MVSEAVAGGLDDGPRAGAVGTEVEIGRVVESRHVGPEFTWRHITQLAAVGIGLQAARPASPAERFPQATSGGANQPGDIGLERADRQQSAEAAGWLAGGVAGDRPAANPDLRRGVEHDRCFVGDGVEFRKPVSGCRADVAAEGIQRAEGTEAVGVDDELAGCGPDGEFRRVRPEEEVDADDELPRG